MATDLKNKVSDQTSDDNAHRQLPKSRRYVGSIETAAYIAQDFADSFSIGKYQNRFIWDVVGIDFTINGVVTLFTGIWDIFNDTFISAMVDRTRTRWGKFRPYLLWMKMPLTLFGMLFWMMPIFFPNTSTTYLPKLIFYFAFNIINETAEHLFQFQEQVCYLR